MPTTRPESPYRSSPPGTADVWSPDNSSHLWREGAFDQNCARCADALASPWPAKADIEVARKYVLLNGVGLGPVVGASLREDLTSACATGAAQAVFRRLVHDDVECGRGWQRDMLALAVVIANSTRDERTERAILETALHHLSEPDLHWACRARIAFGALAAGSKHVTSWWPASQVWNGPKDPLVDALLSALEPMMALDLEWRRLLCDRAIRRLQARSLPSSILTDPRELLVRVRSGDPALARALRVVAFGSLASGASVLAGLGPRLCVAPFIVALCLIFPSLLAEDDEPR